jgi:molybdopterin/thiamine biosynthesis adenylyltransferase
LLCGRVLLDLLVRLDPLIQVVGLDTSDNEAVVDDLPRRFPLEVVGEGPGSWDYTVSIGEDLGDDFTVDADGWKAYLNKSGTRTDNLNPFGPLAASCLAAGEVFKRLLALNAPDNPVTKRIVFCDPMEFSMFSYDRAGENPPLKEFEVDMSVVGAGGISAGLLCALSNLGVYVHGGINVVDDDIVGLENLNRLTYATLDDVKNGAVRKVDSAARFLNKLGDLTVIPFPLKFGAYKETLSPVRKDRKYDFVLMAVDNDEARLEVQRELPLDLLDAGTGVHGNCRVEHIDFLNDECLGCRISRQPVIRVEGDGDSCGCISGISAPSLSFLSFFPGVLLAAEVTKKYSFPDARLNGYFDHIFLYPPNGENKGRTNKSLNCTVQCQSPAVIEAYKRKYESPQ